MIQKRFLIIFLSISILIISINYNCGSNAAKNTTQDKDIEISSLLIALYRNDIAIAKNLINQGADVNVRDKNGFTPLHITTSRGQIDMTILLLKKGADVNASDNNGLTPLYISASLGQIDMALLLINKGALLNPKDRNGYTPLHIASSLGHLDIVQLLVSKGASIDVQNRQGNTPIHEAAYRGHQTIVVFLLKKGGDIFAKTNNATTVLHFSCASGNYQLVKLLIKKGLNPREKSDENLNALHYLAFGKINLITKQYPPIAYTINGENKLFYPRELVIVSTSTYGHYQIFKYLRKKGLSVNARSRHGVTPLHLAALNGLDDLVKLFMQHDANVNAKDIDNETPLHYVTKGNRSSAQFFRKKNYLNIVKLLLKKRVNINLKNKSNITPLHYASASGFDEIVKVLLKQGAKIIKSSVGLTPLHYVFGYDSFGLYKEYYNTVKLLISKGTEFVNLAAGEKNMTPLHYAAQSIKHYHTPIIALMFKKQIRVNAQTLDGHTPLHFAVYHGNFSLVKFLIKNGANQKIKDKNGKLAIEYCSANKDIPESIQKKIYQYLENPSQLTVSRQIRIKNYNKNILLNNLLIKIE